MPRLSVVQRRRRREFDVEKFDNDLQGLPVLAVQRPEVQGSGYACVENGRVKMGGDRLLNFPIVRVGRRFERGDALKKLRLAPRKVAIQGRK